MTVAASALDALVGEEPRDTAWQRFFPWFLVGLWVLTPEIRRLIDWQIGFNSLSVIVLVPIVAMLPLVAVFFGRKKIKLAPDFTVVVCLWAGGFFYALLVGALSGSLFGSVYEVTLFVFPMFVGLWLTTMEPATTRRVFERFAVAALTLGTITSVYGIYQYVSPPPWDIAWVNNSELVSIGQPVPFGLRIFGTLNSPGILSDFLAMTILLTLHRLRKRNLWLLMPLFFCTVALALTFGRTGWLELAVGFVVYVVLSPKRGFAMATVAAAAILTLVVGFNLSLITGDSTSNTELESRLSTFNDIKDDDSAKDRATQTSIALHQALSEPLGQGLGTVGTSTKLSASGSTTVLDNGYLSRFLEMGVFGFACYVAALISALVFSLARLPAAYALRERDDAAAPLMATGIAIQVALIGADLSGDHHVGLLAIVLWLVVGLSSTMRRGRISSPLAEFSGPAPQLGRPAQT